jgi:hypothetical protein
MEVLWKTFWYSVMNVLRKIHVVDHDMTALPLSSSYEFAYLFKVLSIASDHKHPLFAVISHENNCWSTFIDLSDSTFD